MGTDGIGPQGQSGSMLKAQGSRLKAQSPAPSESNRPLISAAG